METKRIVPYGVINCATLVRECLFVDNTAYIRALEPCRTPVFLRPKRFGKSVVCSMLAHYYDINLKDRFDDLSSGYNVGTVVSLDADKVGMAGFTQAQVDAYVDEIFAEYGLDTSLRSAVLTDLKNFYDGYHFTPDSEPLYNATICNWYLRCLVVERKQPSFIIDANVRTDIGWFRRLAQTNPRALEKVRAYVERGEGEFVNRGARSGRPRKHWR